MKSIILVIISLCMSSAIGCTYDNYAQRGAMIGGVTGSALGAAIGDASDAPLAGAAVGALAGTLTGAAIGDGVDQDLALQQSYRMAEQQRLARAVPPAQLIQMSQSGLSDDVIVTQVQSQGVSFSPTANDLISLKAQGVSDAVLNAVQSQSRQPMPVPQRPNRPVVVEEHYYHPWPRPSFRRYAPAHYCPPSRRTYMGFSFSSR